MPWVISSPITAMRRTLLAVGKTAVQRGFPLDAHAFPTLGHPHVRAGQRPR